MRRWNIKAEAGHDTDRRSHPGEFETTQGCRDGRHSVPADPQEAGLWLTTYSNTIALGLSLAPFAGIAFLWFIGVLCDRLGEREDRFSATVFFGSGILFLGMLFRAAALVGAILTSNKEPKEMINSATFHLIRAAAYTIMNLAKDGRRIHDDSINASVLRMLCAALTCSARLPTVAASFVR
jgi:hypothetical protein